MKGKRILGIGIATLDIINMVEEFPAEDSEVRATGQQLRRGGNATNTLVTLARLGHRCSWGGVLADDPDSRHIVADLDNNGVEWRYCRRVPGGRTPTSCIVLNQQNGSRTIIHYRDLPEFGFEDFRHIDPGRFDWVHFEGRNVAETGRMLERCAALRPRLPRSLELEKVRDGMENLFPLAHLLLFSREYALWHGFDDAPELLHAMRERAPHAILTCTWGSEGAWAMDRDGSLYSSPAFPPPRILDTTGAGDVFNAGIIDGLLRGERLEAALRNACRLAGEKCGRMGIG